MPGSIPWELWIGTAKRLGVPLLERAEDRGGSEGGGSVVEGFRFSKDDYSSLDEFSATGTQVVTLGEGLVHQRVGLRREDGPLLSVCVTVGQTTPVALRHQFLKGILYAGTVGAVYPPPAADVGLTVGDAATATDAPAGEGRYLRVVEFYRRTVMVSLFQDGPALDLGALAKAIDARILERPRVANLTASKLRPTITRFTMEGGSAQLNEVVEGQAAWEDPQGGALVAKVFARTGSVSLKGTAITYDGNEPGEDRISLRVANSLNLSDQKDVTIIIR